MADAYSRNLEKGGRVVGNAIGWALRRLYDSARDAAEKRKEREILRPGDPNRELPAWQVQICERVVNKALAYAYDPAVKAIKQPARQLCFELLLYEKGYRKALAGRIEEIFQQMLYNLLCEWLNNPLIIGEEAAGERAFSVPVHMLYDDVAKFIDGFAGSVPQKCLPPDAKPFSRLIANFQRNLLVASGVDPDRWEESGITQPVMAKQVKGKSPAALLDSYFGETPFIRRVIASNFTNVIKSMDCYAWSIMILSSNPLMYFTL
jgi:hypothetical protein